MDEQQIAEAIGALRDAVTARIADAAARGDSAETQRLSAGFTSLDVLENVFGIEASAGG